MVLLALAASPASAADKAKVDLKTKKTAAVVEGDIGWVQLSCPAKSTDAIDFRVEAEPPREG